MVPLYRSHPWHGLSLGDRAPSVVNAFIEMVPTDTVKYELDKTTGILKLDRPQKYSSLCPTLYGFLPQTYSGEASAAYCMERTGRDGIRGDGDPIDLCVLTERFIVRGDLIMSVAPIGGLRIIDKGEADDKLVAVLVGDFVFGHLTDLSECPVELIERLRHYFLTYKDYPGRSEKTTIEITHTYGREEAYEVIARGRTDYSKLKANGS